MVSAFPRDSGVVGLAGIGAFQEFGQNIELADQPYYRDIDQIDQPCYRDIDLVGPRR